MKVIDLFSGLEGFSQAFKDRGHKVFTVDINPKFKPSLVADINNLTVKDFSFKPDVILASPPCNCFSIASVYRHWDKETKRPKDQATLDAIVLVANTISLILRLGPRFWFLENPRGMLRRVLGIPPITTFFASWQSTKERAILIKAFHDKRKPSLKPTDLWGVMPKRIKWKKPKPWQKAPRGSNTGLQGITDRDLRAKIPYGLSLAICKACEKEIK